MTKQFQPGLLSFLSAIRICLNIAVLPFGIVGDGLKNLYSISILHQCIAYAGIITDHSRKTCSFSHKNHKSQRLRRTQGSLAQTFSFRSHRKVGKNANRQLVILSVSEESHTPGTEILRSRSE